MSIFRRSSAQVERRAFQGYDVPDAIRDMSAARQFGGWSQISVTPANVLQVPAVFACTQLTAGVISQMPFDEYRISPDGRRMEVPPSPLIENPSADVSAEDWRFQAIESAQLHGNAVGGVVSRDRLGYPTQVELLAPSRVQVRVDRDRRNVVWRVDGSPVDRDDLWHMVGRPHVGSPLGVGLVEYMFSVAGMGLAARRFGVDFFNSGGSPVVVLQPSTDPGQGYAEELKARVRDAIRTRAPLVLPQSIQQEEWKGSKPSDADLVELLRQNATDVAMFYVIPPELVGGVAGDSMTYSNTEHRIIDLLAFGVSFWLTKLERSLTRSLPRGRYTKANESAIIRTDVKTRTEVLVNEIRGGIVTPNESRVLLDMEPHPMGDNLLWPPFATHQTGAAAPSDDPEVPSNGNA